MTIVEHLLADTFGAHIGKYSERLKVTHKGSVLQQAPLMHLHSVTLIGGGVSISTDAIAACAERGIPILLLAATGEVSASIYSAALVGTVVTRREQLLAYRDARGARLASTFAAAKISNQARTLRYWARNRRKTEPALADTLNDMAADLAAAADALPGIQVEEAEALRAALMGYEGHAAARYWDGARLLVAPEYGWEARIGRGATDPINCLLNYGYGILYGEVERALVFAGLDPYAGFLHADRPGKPSLVLDLIEEFRQIAVDRVVIGLAARAYRVEMDESGRLSQVTRRDFARQILGQLEGRVRYGGERVALRHALQMQARLIAAFVRGEREYTPYLIGE